MGDETNIDEESPELAMQLFKEFGHIIHETSDGWYVELLEVTEEPDK